MTSFAKHSSQTRLLHVGKNLSVAGGKTVNPPVVRASTVVFDNVAQQRSLRGQRDTERVFTYGARGNPTNYALEDMITELEGGYRTRLYPTGLAAIAMTFLAYLKPGDHVLVADSVYEPVRKLTQSFMRDYQISCTFIQPDGSDLQAKIQTNTRLVYLECPGSLIYEMCDVSAIARVAHAHKLLVVADNTWGSGYLYQPLALGADVSVMAATKYLSGHSDVMMGSVCTTKEVWAALNARSDSFGMTVSPDDSYLVLRGTRTLAARLAMHQQHALLVAQWLQGHQQVATVFYPALPEDPNHTLWQRDCAGSNGLLSFELQAGVSLTRAEKFVDALTLFGIGASWGGYESLVTLTDMRAARSLTDWSGRGCVVRLHIGLESPTDLIADLSRAFEA